MIPVRPSAADQSWNVWRRVFKATKPAMPAARKASSAVNTHAACKYTIRTLAPRDFSSGPKNAKRAITITVMMNKVSGDLKHDIGRFYLTTCHCERLGRLSVNSVKQSPVSIQHYV